MKNQTRYIFVVGGVMSSVGKGITTASIGALLQTRGFSVTAIKADPYINVDAGTMNPTEHGEVFVTIDGDETDQDIGNYERFLHQNITSTNYMTTGRIYQDVIRKERNLEYGGKCVEVVPHIPEEIIGRIKKAGKKTKADFVIIEIGGTIGEYQNILFLEAGRMMKLENPDAVKFVLVSYLPVPSKVGEMKTKPTQYAARTLNSAGITADFIVARSTALLDEPRRQKLATFCGIKPENAISAPDVNTIYDVITHFNQEKFPDKILESFGIKDQKSDVRAWKKFIEKINKSTEPVRIGIVGKYFETGDFVLADSYVSVIEALRHAIWTQGHKPDLVWLNASAYEKDPKEAEKKLAQVDGIIIPGGFGSRGIEGKLTAIKIARENKIPYFGLCYGMQLACVEIARNVVGLKDAHTTEINPDTPHPIISINETQRGNVAEKNYGGTMRLGGYSCVLKEGSLAYKAYKQPVIIERHRHRYEFNNDYRQELRDAGVNFTGLNIDADLIEIMEYHDHPWFIGVQFHPEFQSRPFEPHPLFMSFIKACIQQKKSQ